VHVLFRATLVQKSLEKVRLKLATPDIDAHPWLHEVPTPAVQGSAGGRLPRRRPVIHPSVLGSRKHIDRLTLLPWLSEQAAGRRCRPHLHRGILRADLESRMHQYRIGRTGAETHLMQRLNPYVRPTCAHPISREGLKL
jgi:hypothetical protein